MSNQLPITTQPAVIDPSVSQSEKQIDNTSKPWLWQPGQSGNPNGRPPKGYSITEMFKNMLSNSPTKKQLFADRVFKAALDGDMIAARMIWNYMDGTPTSKHELMGKDGQPLYPLPILGSEAPKE